VGHVYRILNASDWKAYVPRLLHSMIARLNLVNGLCGGIMIVWFINGMWCDKV
jgi:hypothetical protein